MTLVNGASVTIAWIAADEVSAYAERIWPRSYVLVRHWQRSTRVSRKRRSPKVYIFSLQVASFRHSSGPPGTATTAGTRCKLASAPNRVGARRSHCDAFSEIRTECVASSRKIFERDFHDVVFYRLLCTSEAVRSAMLLDDTRSSRRCFPAHDCALTDRGSVAGDRHGVVAPLPPASNRVVFRDFACPPGTAMTLQNTRPFQGATPKRFMLSKRI